MNQIEEYEQRKKLRGSRFRWRIFAVLAVLALIAVIAKDFKPEMGPHIARYDVSGVILGDLEREKLLRDIAGNDQIKALMVRINSPGGTVTGSEELYESLREVAESKPVVATMVDVAASGGYITALAADQVFARGSTITGSIGVVFQAPNAHGLMEKIGVQMVEIKSGKLKAEPTPFKPVSADVIAAERELVDDSFKWFLDLVRERRGIGENVIAEVRDGGVYTGRMALELGLIDGIGDLDEARTWLTAEYDIDESLEVVEYEPVVEGRGPLDLFIHAVDRFRPDPAALSQTFSTGLWAIYR